MKVGDRKEENNNELINDKRRNVELMTRGLGNDRKEPELENPANRQPKTHLL